MKRKTSLIPKHPPAVAYLFAVHDAAETAACRAEDFERSARDFQERMDELKDAIWAVAIAARLGELEPWQTTIVVDMFAAFGRVKLPAAGKVGAA